MTNIVQLPAPRAPRSRLTPRVRRDVLADVAAYRMVAGSAARKSQSAEAERIGAEVDEALALFEARGWLDDPASYHVAPPPPAGVRARRNPPFPVRSKTITWDDGFVVRPEEPGAARFASYHRNRIARATIVRHGRSSSADRPWLICVHGFGMGSPALDLRAFRAQHLHHGLGLNLAFLTLPFHGARRTGRSPLPEFPGADMLDNVHGLAQAVWDVRQLLAWVRARTDQRVGLLGLSLGSCVGALAASLADLDAVVLQVPVVDFGTLAADTALRHGAELAANMEIADRARSMLAPVSPLALTPRVPHDKRVIIAGTLDQFVRASTQAIALWRHWDGPEVHWYHGGHVSLFWSQRARRAVDESLRRVLLDA